MLEPLPNADFPVGAGPLEQIDHLVWGGRSLEQEIRRLESLTGLEAGSGGRHPAEGTRNAVLRILPGAYLELIAPDPDQPAPPYARWFGLDDLERPRLITWAVKCDDLERRVVAAASAGVRLGEIRAGRRELPDGQVLTWRLTYPDLRPGDGIVPFLIDWGDGPHPARSAPSGMDLIELRAEHPDPPSVLRVLELLGVELPVARGHAPGLVAGFHTPRGRWELR